MLEKVKPIYMLALIAAIISGLVIVVYNLTYVDTSNILTDKQAAAVKQIYGEGDYAVVPLTTENDKGEKVDSEIAKKISDAGLDVAKVIKKSDGSLAFEFLVKGYKSGFDIMVGVKDGKVAGVAIVSVGEETPGLGTKTNDENFLSRFKGADKKVTIVKSETNVAEGQVQGITSATLSSRGVATAVNNALKAYEAIGGEAQ